ncbi:MAG: hypothetical protein WC404_05425 [Candidatus Omnitrophota bacterium]
MEKNNAVEQCAECPLCKFSRNRKNKGILYSIARKVQSTCPVCKEANEKSGKDLQKSKFF